MSTKHISIFSKQNSYNTPSVHHAVGVARCLDAAICLRSLDAAVNGQCIQLSPGTCSAVSATYSFRSSHYSFFRCSESCFVRLRPAANQVIICLMRAAQSLQSNVGGAADGQAVAFVLDATSDFMGHLPPDTEILMLRMSQERFVKIVQPWFGFASSHQVGSLLKRAAPVEPAQFDHCVLARAVNEDDSVRMVRNTEHAGESASLEASILLPFLGALLPITENRLLRSPEPQHAALVEKAVDFILRNYAERITLDDICGECGASASSLAAAFSRNLGLTPVRFILQVRLQHAHTLLCSSLGRASVTNVATETGFWHYGRFSGYYRAQFLELPSETLWRFSNPETGPSLKKEPRTGVLACETPCPSGMEGALDS